jgi:hypothetical protein
LLGLRELDELLQILTQWMSYFEQVRLGLSTDVLAAATGVAGWLRSDWREVHRLLSMSEHDQ